MEHKPDLAARAHAFLFVEGGAISRRKLGALLKCTEGELQKTLDALSLRLEGSGLSLVRSETEVSLTTSKETSLLSTKNFTMMQNH